MQTEHELIRVIIIIDIAKERKGISFRMDLHCILIRVCTLQEHAKGVCSNGVAGSISSETINYLSKQNMPI